jgi:hypothetical protein
LIEPQLFFIIFESTLYERSPFCLEEKLNF